MSSSAGGWGMGGVVVSSSHIFSAAPSSSSFPCSIVGSLHKLLQCESFPWTAVLHKLFQHGSFPMGHSPSATDCSSVDPPWGHRSCHQTCSAWALVSMGAHVLPGACSSSMGFPWGYIILWASTCSGLRSFTDCMWNEQPL